MAAGRNKKPRPTGWRRVRRWIVRSVGGSLLVALFLLLALSILLSNLDRPAVSNPVADYFRQTLGVDITYDVLYASRMSELVGHNIRLSSPAQVRQEAPAFLTIGSIHATWAPETLVTGPFSIHTVSIDDIALTVVVDEQGNTTFDYLVPPDQKNTPTPASTPEAQPLALSEVLTLIPTSLCLEDLTVNGFTLTIVQLTSGDRRRVTTLDGLKLQATLSQEGGHPSGTVHLLSESEAGTTLTTEETGDDGTVTSNLWQGDVDFQVDLKDQTVSASLSSLLDNQTLVDLPIPAGKVLGLETHIKFLPETRTTQIELPRFDLLGDAVRAKISASAQDREDGTLGFHIEAAQIEVAVQKLLPFLSLPDELKLGDGRLEARANQLDIDPDTFYPTSGTASLSGWVKHIRWEDGGASASVGKLSVDTTATVTGLLEQDFSLRATVDTMTASVAPDRINCPRATLAVSGRHTRLNLENPEAFVGDVRVAATTRGATGKWGSTRISEGDLSLELSSRLTGKQPYAIDGKLSVEQLRLADPNVGNQDLSGATLDTRVHRVRFDPDDLASAQGEVTLTAGFGPLSVDALVKHSPEVTQWRVTVDANTLTSLAPFLNPLLGPGEKVAWARTGFHVSSEGTARGLTGGGPVAIQQRAKVSGRNLNYATLDYAVDVPRIDGTVSYQGGLDTGTLGLNLTLSRWHYDVLWADRPTNVAMQVAMSLSADRYQVRVRRYQGDVNYRDGDLLVALAGIAGIADMTYEQGKLNGTADLKTARIDYSDGPDQVWLEDVAHHLRLASSDDIERGVLELGYRAEAGQMGQRYTTLYPSVDMRADLTLRLARLSAFSLDRCVVESVRGGTRLELAMAMDDQDGNLAALARGGEGRADAGRKGPGALLASVPITAGESLTISGVLRQDLGSLKGDPSLMSASGELVVPFRVESPEQVQYRLSSTLQFHDVSLKVPEEELDVQGLSGKCLIVEEFQDSPDGFLLVPRARSNVYARAAFPDTQPYLSGDSYFSVEHLVWSNLFDAGPIAGNFRVDRNMIRLDQLQMGVAQGTVSGQLLIDYREKDTAVFFRGTANGLRLAKDSSERLDANMALDFDLDKLDLNGRAHIVRVGRKTLLAMIDAVDPYHEDVDLNEVRLALKAGYPKFVRVDFDHGFMSLKIDLGGVAGTVRISEIRGIPVGPLLNTYLGDLL